MAHTITDVKIATFACGFTVGFGFLTGWEAIKQTQRARDPLRSIYIWLIWGEFLACTAITIQAYLFLGGQVPFNLPFLFILLVWWVLQVQLLLQIIINRVAVVMSDRRKAARIKWGTAAIITCVNISVFCIWIPARLQVSDTFVKINTIWDRIEKIIILLVDAGLNWYFVKMVKERLIAQGSTKYDALVRFNTRIIMVSLAMDAVIIATMSLNNGAVYIQLHPLAYIVKLNIEMSMASLITKIARDANICDGFELSDSRNGGARSGTQPGTFIGTSSLVVHTQKDVIVDSHSIDDDRSSNSHNHMNGSDNDDRPLNDKPWGGRMGHSAAITSN